MSRFEVLSNGSQSQITNSDTEKDDKMSLNCSLNKINIKEKRKNAKPFEVMAIKKKKKTNKSRIPGVVTENVHKKNRKTIDQSKKKIENEKNQRPNNLTSLKI
jgi:hypothetical protein